jgi:hypothetical protein
MHLTLSLRVNSGNIQQPTSNIEHPMLARMAVFGCSMLDVGCWVFASFGSTGQSASASRAAAREVGRGQKAGADTEVPARLLNRAWDKIAGTDVPDAPEESRFRG